MEETSSIDIICRQTDYDKETAKQKLMHVAITAVENPSELNDKTVKEFNTQINILLNKQGLEWISQ